MVDPLWEDIVPLPFTDGGPTFHKQNTRIKLFKNSGECTLDQKIPPVRQICLQHAHCLASSH